MNYEALLRSQIARTQWARKPEEQEAPICFDPYDTKPIKWEITHAKPTFCLKRAIKMYQVIEDMRRDD